MDQREEKLREKKKADESLLERISSKLFDSFIQTFIYAVYDFVERSEKKKKINNNELCDAKKKKKFFSVLL